jgi:predicted flap endonuclease-1-like 5' DNA nuclease
MARLSDIEGIGPAYASKLTRAGVRSTERLLAVGGTPQGRARLAEETGISGALILEWVNHADLFRIRGVGGSYADLLEAAGVDTVPELATRNAANLTETLRRMSDEKHLVRAVPAVPRVTGWITQAKSLERAVHY